MFRLQDQRPTIEYLSTPRRTVTVSEPTGTTTDTPICLRRVNASMARSALDYRTASLGGVFVVLIAPIFDFLSRVCASRPQHNQGKGEYNFWGRDTHQFENALLCSISHFDACAIRKASKPFMQSLKIGNSAR
ncbi:hypothetical protein A0H81_10109 [Grifola frondosa]|uniref:Uncharacterized protein n=1 Tax=Grifola frondosa TaxID=5627 RepID=A0A1C7LXR6_GRIFR|nr:hypothetical protein A0H81_10109 [Grifola frondosa]